MPIELKDFGEFLDIEITDETTTDQVKEAFNAKYVPVETHSKALGEVNGIIASATKKAFKEIGLEYNPDELKGKDTKELPTYFASLAKAKFDELESQKGSTAEQIEAKYKEDLNKFKNQLTEKETLLGDLQNQFETFKGEIQKKERTNKISGEFEKHFGALNFSKSVHPLAPKGFRSKLQTEFSFDLNEDGRHVVFDAEGKLITSKVKAGEPASYEEVIYDAFKKEDGLEQVVDPKKTTTFATTPVHVVQQNNGNVRQVAPRDI